MADGLLPNNIADLIATTLANLPENFYQYYQKYTRYTSRYLFDEKKVVLTSGQSITRNVTVTDAGTAGLDSLYGTTSPTQINVQQVLNVPWRFAKVNWSLDNREIQMNSNGAQIIDLIKVRRDAAANDMANLIEEKMWAGGITEDSLQPWGVTYWIPPITTTQVSAGTSGFQGLAAPNTGASTVGGVNPTTYSRHRSYNDVWDVSDGSITEAGIKKITTMWRKLGFEVPVYTQDQMHEDYSQYRIYTDNNVMGNYEQQARNGNDNLGNDVGMYAGATVFKRIPVEYNPQLDTANATYRGLNPFYMLNLKHFKATCLRGFDFKEYPGLTDRDQPNVSTVYTDLVWNWAVDNRQRVGGLLSYVT